MYNNTGNELWMALAEKAYVQINELGWLRTGLSGNGQNAYAAIEGGYIYAALGQVTGQATTSFASTAASNELLDIRRGLQRRQVDWLCLEGHASLQPRRRQPRLRRRRLQRREPDRDAVQSLGHWVRHWSR